MVMTRVLVLEGERLKLPRKLADGVLQRFDDVYGLSVYKNQAPACEPPASEQEARQYYDAHPEAFVLPPQARVERIILPAATEIGGGSAMAWLQDQARAVAQGQRKFALVAMRAQGEYSLDTQGDLGWLTLDGDHTLMRALQTVKAGEMLGPVQEGDYVYLFSVLQKREARQLSWDESKSFAVSRAASHCRQEAQIRIRTDLFKRYGVEIDRAAIREFTTGANSIAADKADGKPDDKVDAKPQQ
ncbi:MAG: peptidyl-prolyl cis-trans isomerase [Acidovorax sp.]|nr:peptidyl-prolyl cis-trans isomerase [Acidovorax sp.]